MNKIKRIKELNKLLNKASYAYYGLDKPIMNDKEYDDLYDELVKLEKETEYVLAGSPTQKVQGYVLDGFKKIEHSKPMLSADKTKEVSEVEKFIDNRDFYCSYKLDGCFDKHTKIIMADDSLKEISKIKVGDIVKSFNEETKKISNSRVLRVYNNGMKEDNEWIRLSLDNNKNINGTRHHITCTKNHKFFTPNGWIEAGSLTEKSEVYCYDYNLSFEQEQFILGILLGDGWFVRRSENTSSYDIHYSKTDNFPYNNLIKYSNEMFKHNNPTISNHTSGYGSDILNTNLHSINVPNYMINRDNKLRCGLTFTKEVCEHLTPLSLAIFYMDDGSKTPCQEDGNISTYNKQVRCQLALNRHALNEVKIFSDWLNDKGYINNYSFEKEVASGKGDGYHIIMTVEGTRKFFDDICKYIPNELRKIKLGLQEKWQKSDLIKWWECTGDYGLTRYVIGNVKNGCRRRYTKGIRDRKIYNESFDLEIDGNHTYFAEGYAVHNCTLVVKYKDGKFVQGITRGNGTVGEDVTEQCRFIKNLPMEISNKHDIELRGECVISWDEFHRINSTLEEPYSHPRNLAAGTLRNLDLNIVRDRNLSFVVFELVSPTFTHKWDGLKAIEDMGFECVGRAKGTIENCVEGMQPDWYTYPVDGLIFELNSSELSKLLGATSHHENCRIALKWEDTLYKTKLTDIEWNTSKTGLINPVAIFEPVDLDGAITTRATLHNISYIEDLQLGIGDEIVVYRANMVIPKVHDNLTKSNTWTFPDECPVCGGITKIVKENDSKVLMCDNPNCKGKLLGKLTHAVSKNALNIDGLSEQTLEKLIELRWLNSFQDIYRLSEHKDKMSKLDGFGKRSVEKLIDAIEKSRSITLDRFIYALCIEHLGRVMSKNVSAYCNDDIEVFCDLINNDKIYELKKIDGFGENILSSIKNWTNKNWSMFLKLKEEFIFLEKSKNIENQKFKNQTFCITGKLEHFNNRDGLIMVIEENGGKYVNSISKNTNYLINNNINSDSTKNKKAQDVGCKIITENDFIRMLEG